MSACRTCLALDCVGDDDLRIYSLQSTLYPVVVPLQFNIPGATISFQCCDGAILSRLILQGMTPAQLNALVSGMLAECNLRISGCVPSTPETPVTLFYSSSARCRVYCPDGNPFTYTLGAGAFIGLSQAEADAAASSAACSSASIHQMCLSNLKFDQICLGQFFTTNITASSAFMTSAATWYLVSGSVPAGVTLVGSGFFATLSGAPTAGGVSTFRVRVVAANGDFMEKSFTFTVLSVTPTAMPSITTGQAFSQTMTLSGASGAVAWAVSSGVLPAGLSFSAAGVLSGTPTTGGAYAFTLAGTNGASVCTRAFTGTVAWINTEQSFTAECPPGETGDPVTVTIPAGDFTSLVSQADANAQALAEATSQAEAAIVCESNNTHSLIVSAGSVDNMLIPASTDFDITGPFTIEFYMKWTGGSGTNRGIIGRHRAGTSGWLIYMDTLDRVNFVNQGGSVFPILSAAQAPINTWFHVAYAYSAASSGPSHYQWKNGSLVGSLAIGVSIPVTPPADTVQRIGASNDATNNPYDAFEGLIDEVRFWNVFRNTPEIPDNWDKRISVPQANLVGYWTMENSAADISGNGHNGTLENSAAYSTDCPVLS